ncbi:MAG TPA: enoyl-CoA hydratase/isomerase family protein, partial [Sorangium sp.]|nr:enoyl-CoA hydratase/isomerase family protein [Sorangium sp.]
MRPLRERASMPRNMSYVQQQRRDGITEVVLNRPKVNAMNSALMTELTHTFAALASDETVKGVLLRGEGKCLSAGLDLREVAQLDSASLGQFLDLFD